MTLTVQQRSRTLFKDGYRCALTTDNALLVTKPGGRCAYRVTERGCNCPASTTCKHSLGAALLAWAQADALTDEANALDCEIVTTHTVADRHGCRLTATGMDLRRQVLALERSARRLRAWAEAQAGGVVAVERVLAAAAAARMERAA